MRIGIDCRIAGYTWGGTAIYVRRLVRAMVRSVEDGDELLLLRAARRDDQLTFDPTKNVSEHSLFTPSHHRWEQLLLPLELMRTPVEVLHSPDFIPPFHRRCRSVITVHDLAFLMYPQFLTAESRRYFNGQIERAVHCADRIIAVSEATKRDLVDRVNAPAEKVDVVYEAADEEFCPAPDQEALERALDERGWPSGYVLHVGTIEPRKNLPNLLRAFRRVKSGGYAGKLLLAGARGWLIEESLAEIERQGLADDVLEVNSFSREELLLLYRGATMLAAPSRYEGFGLPLIEAMACGLPVLTSNVSSLPEIAQGAALLVDPEDVEAIAAGMTAILTDEGVRETLRQKGLARAADFSWEATAKQTLAVYHRAV